MPHTSNATTHFETIRFEAPARPRPMGPIPDGTRFSIIDNGDGFATRRADALCSACAQPVGLHTDLTAIGDRWLHSACVRPSH
jgi:hypothetical protein